MVSTKSRILAVDDDQNILHLLERFLDRSGFECLTASNTAAAVDLLEGNEFDLLLLDIAMPKTSGIDFLPEVVTRYPDMAVIMVTATADTATAIRAIREGAVDLFTKPLDLEEMSSRIKRTLERGARRLKIRHYQKRLEQLIQEGADDFQLRTWELEDLNRDFRSLLREGASDQEAHDRLHAGLAEFSENALTGLVLTSRDLTRRKRAEKEVAAALDKAEEADRLKSELLSTVSHELHIPLTAIKGFATTLLDNDDRLEQMEKREFLQEIDGAADRLTSLIDHLLQFSRLEAGMLPVDPVPACLDEIIAGALAHFRMRAPERLATMEVPDDLGLVIVDPRRLREVLDNLLDNALKYTPPESSIWIECSKATQDLQPLVRITVRDDGPGIPDGQLDSIFEPFNQSPGLATCNAKGVGLGLAICRHIINAHHGSLTAEHAPGHGVSFVISLPSAGIDCNEETRRIKRERSAFSKEGMAHPYR